MKSLFQLNTGMNKNSNNELASLNDEMKKIRERATQTVIELIKQIAAQNGGNDDDGICVGGAWAVSETYDHFIDDALWGSYEILYCCVKADEKGFSVVLDNDEEDFVDGASLFLENVLGLIERLNEMLNV